MSARTSGSAMSKVLLSVEFLKKLLDLARDVVETKRAVPPIEEEERGRQALTELFRRSEGRRYASHRRTTGQRHQ